MVQGGNWGSKRALRGAALAALAALPLIAAVAIVTAPRVSAANCAAEEVKIGIVEATGCFTTRTPQGQTAVYETTTKFRMNGFDVQPHQGVTVTFSPQDGQKRGASVTTNNGFVDLTANHAAWGPVHFNNMNFAFSPPASGEFTLAESALAQPFISIAGLSPLGVKQPIKLTEEGAEFDLSFDIGGFFLHLVTHSDKKLSFGVEFEVKDGRFKVASGKFGVEDFELANFLEVREADLEFSDKLIDANFDASLKGLGAEKAVIGGATVEDPFGKGFNLTRFRLGLPIPNIQLGTSGVFLQKLAVDVFTAPPYGGKGTVGLTAGPKTRFFGRDVDAVDVEGTIEVRGADTAHNKPGFFSVGGDFTLVTLPVGNAHFAYYFGQGTDFGLNFGIGFPSGRNDPGQPTYVGGGFNGWTTAHHFDLEGSAKLKLLGIDLLGAQTVVSDIGFAGCVQVIAWIGGGLRWSDGRGELLGGWTCNTGGYRPQRNAARAASHGPAHVKLNTGHRVVRIAAHDGEEAPQATLSHPDGRTLTTPEPGDEDGIEMSEHGAGLGATDGTSAFVIDGDASGRWRLNPAPGSSGIESVEVAKELPDHRVKARITGRGRKRTLRWSARDIPHQTLQFSERLPNGREVLIFETDKARGKHRFRPVEGPGTFNAKRKLAVDVMQRLNTPRDELVADRYVVRRQPAPKRVRALRVERQLNEVVVGWKRSRRAAHYRVAASAGGEATYTKQVSSKRRRVRLPVGTTKKMRVKVTPINGQGRRGKAAKRVLDTEALVPNRRVAARRLVKRAKLTRSGSVIAHPECPDGGHCEVTLRVKRGKRTLGSARTTLPPDMTDRIVVKLRGGARAARRGRIELRGRVEQLHGRATHRVSR